MRPLHSCPKTWAEGSPAARSSWPRVKQAAASSCQCQLGTALCPFAQSGFLEVGDMAPLPAFPAEGSALGLAPSWCSENCLLNGVRVTPRSALDIVEIANWFS